MVGHMIGGQIKHPPDKNHLNYFMNTFFNIYSVCTGRLMD